jgi:NitT/TauT family transport system ATP-binding protein
VANGNVAEPPVYSGHPAGVLLEVDHVSKGFRDPTNERSILRVVDDVSFEMKPAEFVTLIGPSGCGKSTLLRIIAGLIPASQGSIYVHGKKLHGLNDDCAFVFQHVGLVPWRNVERNVALSLELNNHRRLNAAEKDAVHETLRMVGLIGFEKYYPYQISGGMQQRVGIARALVTEPRLLLMDEPFGALDAQTRALLQDEMVPLFSRLKVATVFVTHDLDEAVYLSDRVIVMTRRPTKIQEVIDVPMPTPRTGYDVRTHPKFSELRNQIWRLLRPENL